MGYDESFEANVASEQSIEQSFDDTYQGQPTVSGSSENLLNPNQSGGRNSAEREVDDYEDDNMEAGTMEEDGENEDYDQAVDAGMAVAAGASHSLVGGSRVGFDDMEENEDMLDIEEGSKGIEVYDEVELKDDDDMVTNEEGTFTDEEYELREGEELLVYDHRPGDVNCWCVPARVSGARDLCSRTFAWAKLNKNEILGGITVSMSQVPEALSAAVIAGVSPTLALQSTWILNLISTLIGGRPGLISGASATVAIALANLVKNHGVEYVFVTIMFAGLLQILFGFLGFGAIVRLVPYPVITGFVNSMALLISAAQLRFWRVPSEGASSSEGRLGHSWNNFTDEGSEWADTSTSITMLVEALVTMIICFGLPRVTRTIPSALVAIIFVTIMDVALVRNIGYESIRISDYASPEIDGVQTALASQNRVQLDWDTFGKIYLTGIAVFGVSLIETLMTSTVLDDMSGTRTQRNRVSLGVGIGNVVSGLLGGMGGSASMGQTMLANLSGSFTRLCSFIAAAFFALFVYLASVLVKHIPLSATAGVMFYVSIKLFRWHSILQTLAAIMPLRLRESLQLDCKVARTDIIIMLTVMAISLIFDLGIAVLAGVVMAVFAFVWDSSNRIVVEKEIIEEEGTVTYNIAGPLFFATAQGFVDTFANEDFGDDPEEVVIMLEGADVYDWSGMKALKAVHDRLVDIGKVVALASISPSSRRLMEKNANMWSGVSFLEVEEIDEDMTTSLQSTVKQISTIDEDSKQIME